MERIAKSSAVAFRVAMQLADAFTNILLARKSPPAGHYGEVALACETLAGAHALHRCGVVQCIQHGGDDGVHVQLGVLRLEKP